MTTGLLVHPELKVAERYLQPGPDTDNVNNMDIDWSTWKKVEATGGLLPDLWYVMPKGLLTNYFRWYKERGS